MHEGRTANIKKVSYREDGRHHFLSLGLRVVSGLAVPLAFNGCDRTEGDEHNATPVKNFIQPTLLESKDGLLDIGLKVSYFHTELSGPDPLKQYPVSLRAYGYNTNVPDFFGPTLVVKGGDQLRIKLINNLPFNPPAAIDPLLYVNALRRFLWKKWELSPDIFNREIKFIRRDFLMWKFFPPPLPW